MSVASSLRTEEETLNDLWSAEDYIHSKKEADVAARKFAQMSTKLATALDIRCSGTLGTLSVRKQLLVLIHYCIGNQKLRVNGNTLVPSTAFLVVSAVV